MIKSFHLDLQRNEADIVLVVSRLINGKKEGPFNLKIIFSDLIEVSLFDKFPTDGYYLQFSFWDDNQKIIGLSFNIHDSSSHTYEEDNWVIKAEE